MPALHVLSAHVSARPILVHQLQCLKCCRRIRTAAADAAECMSLIPSRDLQMHSTWGCYASRDDHLPALRWTRKRLLGMMLLAEAQV